MSSPLRALAADLRKRRGVKLLPGKRHLRIFCNGSLVGVLPLNLATDNRAALKRTLGALRRAGLRDL
jgi:hypothetical protein